VSSKHQSHDPHTHSGKKQPREHKTPNGVDAEIGKVVVVVVVVRFLFFQIDVWNVPKYVTNDIFVSLMVHHQNPM
jgi:hypothetical protein